MQISAALNYTFGSFLVVTLIFFDYARKYNTDSFQRFIFLQILAFAMIAQGCNLIDFIFEAHSGTTFRNVFFLINTLYFTFEVLSFLYIAVFVDYTVYKDPSRSKKIIAGAWILTGFHIMLLVFNFQNQFYFDIATEGNILVPGKYYFIYLILGYSPILLILYEIVSSFKSFLKYQFHLLIIFWGFITAGILADQLFGTSTLVWPCYTAALLYAYLLIIRTDSKIDALTGIGNRYAFNEFIDSLSRKNLKEKDGSAEAYSVVMIDIDHFKKINDTLGHAEGDNALRDMATIIKGCIRHSDFTARYGGDEFVLVVSARYDIEKILSRIHEALDLQNQKSLRPYALEMSYGYDVFTLGQNRSLNEFINHVDGLMYKQKEEHRRRHDGEQRS